MSWKDFFELDEGEPGSPEWYLNKVKDWTDPNPPPVVEQHDGVYVVRDDFLVGGTKERIYDYMVQNDPAKEWVYGGGSRWGYGQIGLAAVCKKYGKRATVFIAAAKELHPSSVKAQELGCQIIPCNMGMLRHPRTCQKVCCRRPTTPKTCRVQRRSGSYWICYKGGAYYSI
jgi:hypothetical protein